jgi:hypothetical protein
MSYQTSLFHPRYSATRVTVWRIDGDTALISDDEQTIRHQDRMIPIADLPNRQPQRWWVNTAALRHVQHV